MTTIEYAYNRFCKERFPRPSEEQVSALEQRIGVTLPEDYRQFVLHFNGGYFNERAITPVVEGTPMDALTSLSGIGASHRESELGDPTAIALFDDNDPPKIVPVGDTEMGGLIILVTEPEGRGEIWMKEALGTFYYLADGIAAFFDLLRTPTWETPT
jgi:SMI1 / KNR4 family (SUKH-1)